MLLPSWTHWCLYEPWNTERNVSISRKNVVIIIKYKNLFTTTNIEQEIRVLAACNNQQNFAVLNTI